MRIDARGSGAGVRAHHNRPPGYLFLQEALQQYRTLGRAPARWDGTDERAEPLTSPFHEWLVAQPNDSEERGEPGSRERLAGDYRAAVRNGDHGIAVDPEMLLEILHKVNASDEFFRAARSALGEWASTSPTSRSLRKEAPAGNNSDHG